MGTLKQYLALSLHTQMVAMEKPNPTAKPLNKKKAEHLLMLTQYLGINASIYSGQNS